MPDWVSAKEMTQISAFKTVMTVYRLQCEVVSHEHQALNRIIGRQRLSYWCPSIYVVSYTDYLYTEMNLGIINFQCIM